MARRLDLELFEMSESDGGAPQLIERDVIPTIHVSGVRVMVEGPNLRYVFWDDIHGLGSEPESRVVSRISMERRAAYRLMTELQGVFAGEH